MTQQYLTTGELAKRWKVRENTLAHWRNDGIGPAFFKIHGNVLYQLDDIVRYESKGKRHSTSTAFSASTTQGDQQ